MPALCSYPLAALAAIVYAWCRSQRRHIWWIAAALGVIAPAAAWAARLSGDNYRNYWISHGASGEFLNKINPLINHLPSQPRGWRSGSASSCS
jgi:hypothetical protein